jgi:hypothetical protein
MKEKLFSQISALKACENRFVFQIRFTQSLVGPKVVDGSFGKFFGGLWPSLIPKTSNFPSPEPNHRLPRRIDCWLGSAFGLQEVGRNLLLDRPLGQETNNL